MSKAPSKTINSDSSVLHKVLVRLAVTVLIGAAVVCLFSVFFCGYTIFRRQVVLDINNIYYQALLVSVFFSALFCLSLCLKENVKINLSLVIIFGLITIYSIDIVLYYRNVKTGNTKLEVISNLREQGNQVSTHFLPFLQTNKNLRFTIDGRETYLLGGRSNILTVLCKERSAWSIYQSDEHGFNNPIGLYVPDNVDIMIVGDSFVHGYCVPPRETIAAFIRKKYPKAISLGIGGNGAMLRLATLKEYGEPIRPKIVLWVYTEHTLARLFNEFNHILINYLDSTFSQGLFYIQPEINKQLESIIGPIIPWLDNRLVRILVLRDLRSTLLSAINNIKSRKVLERVANSIPSNFEHYFHKYNLKSLDDALYTYSGKKSTFRYYLKNTEIRNYDAPQFFLDEYKEILATAKKIVEGWGGQLIYVYLPTSFYTWGKVDSIYSISDHDMIMNTVQKLNLPAIDLYSDFQKLDCSDLWRDSECGGHFDGRGYQLVAEMILNKLKEIKIETGK